MKLERLEILDLISTKNLIVNEVLGNLDKKFYYSKFDLEINMALVLFTLLGNTDLHSEMDKEDINWIDFMNDNYKLIEELKNGEKGETYKEIYNEISKGAEYKAKFNASIGSVIDELSQVFTEENIAKIQKMINENVEANK